MKKTLQEIYEEMYPELKCLPKSANSFVFKLISDTNAPMPFENFALNQVLISEENYERSKKERIPIEKMRKYFYRVTKEKTLANIITEEIISEPKGLWIKMYSMYEYE